MPAVGYKFNGKLELNKQYGFIWTSTPGSHLIGEALANNIVSSSAIIDIPDAFVGQSIRPVCKPAKPATALETVASDAKIFAINGRIFGAENARIYDILGRDVTRMNGNLKGVFVVKFANNAQKIIVR